MNEFLKGTRIGRIGKKKGFSLNDIPDLIGKVAIVTGATTGLGRETASALAGKGARIVVAARKEAKGEPPVEAVLKSIRQEAGVKGRCPAPQVEFMELDLASLASVKRFAATFLERFDRLDILVNNAGVSLCPYLLSEDGLELHFAVNHLGHFYLTNLLLDILAGSAPSRIVIVSSRHHHDPYPGGLRLSLDEVNRREGYDPSRAYGYSKLCNLLFMKTLNEKLLEMNAGVYVNAAHPGFVNAAGITRHISQSMGKFAYYAGRAFQSMVALSVPDGALTQIYLASAGEIERRNIRGKYFGPIAQEYEMSPLAEDGEAARRLWKFSADLIRQLAPGA